MKLSHNIRNYNFQAELIHLGRKPLISRVQSGLENELGILPPPRPTCTSNIRLVNYSGVYVTLAQLSQ